MRIFLICPVRFASEEQTRLIADWVRQQENVEGNVVHWPARDTMQDQDSLKICEDNRFAMEHSDEVHVWYEPTSQGSVFDIGMAFVMRKPVFLVNPSAVVPTESKSYNNLVIILDKQAREWKQTMVDLTKVSAGQVGFCEYDEDHRMRVPVSRREFQRMVAGINHNESEIEGELAGMPYDEDPAQEAANR